jgi:stage VI sporulation protein D
MSPDAGRADAGWPGRFPAGLPLLLLAAALLLTACVTEKDLRRTETDLTAVKGNIEGLGTSLEKRQAGMSEEIQAIKRSIASLKSRDDEFGQSLLQLLQRLKLDKTEMDDFHRQQKMNTTEYQKTLDEQIGRLETRLADRQKALETSVAELRRLLDEAAAREASRDTEQDRRLVETTNRLNAFLETTNEENARLRKAILDLTQSQNGLVDRVNELTKGMAAVRDSLKAPQGRFHVIAEGETLGAIASRYGLTVDELIRINNLDNPDNIRVGQKLLLSAP